ncbi:MAG: hypothetical protein IPP56_16790 [Bacteroidetes bacterium]|nr:hypothetical protein [Bacteroidota bacterium]
MKTKTILFSLIALALLSSCRTVVDLGKLNMVSNRNVDTDMSDYVLIKNYAGGSKKEIKRALRKTKAKTMEQAIDETVRNVAGGEFLKNVKVYGVKRKKAMYLLVEGDVWGLPENESFRGFKVGDVVQWKELTFTKKGVITGLTDARRCMVREEGKENSISLKFASLKKVVD